MFSGMKIVAMDKDTSLQLTNAVGHKYSPRIHKYAVEDEYSPLQIKDVVRKTYLTLRHTSIALTQGWFGDGCLVITFANTQINTQIKTTWQNVDE